MGIEQTARQTAQSCQTINVNHYFVVPFLFRSRFFQWESLLFDENEPRQDLDILQRVKFYLRQEPSHMDTIGMGACKLMSQIRTYDEEGM